MKILESSICDLNDYFTTLKTDHGRRLELRFRIHGDYGLVRWATQGDLQYLPSLEIAAEKIENDFPYYPSVKQIGVIVLRLVKGVQKDFGALRGMRTEEDDMLKLRQYCERAGHRLQEWERSLMVAMRPRRLQLPERGANYDDATRDRCHQS